VHKAERVETKWAEYLAAGDDAKADLVLLIVEREREAAVAAARRLRAAQDALATIPAEAPTDAMLDFANGLREAIRGRVDPTGSMAEVNEALRELFACFVITPDPEEAAHPDNPFRGILIQPWLRPDAAPEPDGAWLPLLARASHGPPPLRSLLAADPEGNVQDSHSYLRTNPNRSEFAASQA
jgi:hypothetical protein